MELWVIMGSEKVAGEHKLDLDSLKFYFPLERKLNLTFGASIKQRLSLTLEQRD